MVTFVCYSRHRDSTAFSVQDKIAIVTLTNVGDAIAMWFEGMLRLATGIACFSMTWSLKQGERVVWMEGMADLLRQLKA